MSSLAKYVRRLWKANIRAPSLAEDKCSMGMTLKERQEGLAEALVGSDVSCAKWLVPWQLGSQPQVRLFCFSYAGTGASMFRSWPAALPSLVDVIAIQLPGRESRFRERCVTRMDEITTAVVRSVQPYLDVPFVVFGHSLGALIGFEFVQGLQAIGAPLPLRLIASGMRPPHLAASVPPMSHLADDLLIAEVQRRYGSWQREFLEQPEALRVFLPILRSDLRLFEAYRCTEERCLSVAITALGGEQDEWSQMNLLQGWQRYTSRELSVRMYPGRHLFIHSASEQILRDLSREIATLY
jgi:surfactin synthase thioesterase subunit